MDYWPGYDEPVVIHGRPNRNRPRMYTEHALPRQRLYSGPDGQLFVPAGAGHHRASSISGVRPAQVIINNDNGMAWEDARSEGRRPSSSHGGRYYYDDRYYEDHRDRSRVRIRTPSPYVDYETQQKLKQLEELQKKEEDEKQRKQIEDEIRLQQAKEEAEHRERLKEEKELKKKAVEEYELKKAEEKIKKEKEKEKEDEEFRERMRKTLWANGYSDEQIERMIKKAENKDSKHAVVKVRDGMRLTRPTYVKVHRKYIDPETLDIYELPWEWDDVRFPSIVVCLCKANGK